MDLVVQTWTQQASLSVQIQLELTIVDKWNSLFPFLHLLIWNGSAHSIPNTNHVEIFTNFN